MDLSIIMPMYNCCKNVEKTLKKLHAQQKDNKIRLQVIVINDGSKEKADGVEKACKQYGYDYIYQENRGGAAACNVGLDHVRGNYFTFIDSDDDITDGYLKHMERELFGISELICNYWVYLDWRLGERFPMPLPNHNIWANVYKTGLYGHVRFDEARNVAWDWDWLQRAYEQAPSPIAIYTSNITNIYNDVRPDSITNMHKRGEITEYR